MTKWDYIRIELDKNSIVTAFLISPPRPSNAELLTALGLKATGNLVHGKTYADIPPNPVSADDHLHELWWRAVELLLSRGWEPLQVDTGCQGSMHFKLVVAASEPYMEQLGLK